MAKAKVHSLYVHLSNPSIVTLCGLLDSDALLVTKERERITCVKCTGLADRQHKMDLIDARAAAKQQKENENA